MSQTRRSGPATGRPDNTNTPILTPGATLSAIEALAHPQDLWTSEQVAYVIALAFESGHASGYATADAELVEALIGALGGPEAKTRKQAVDWHHKAIEARELRRRADDEARLPRPGDYLGGPVDWETGRPVREARHLTAVAA